MQEPGARGFGELGYPKFPIAERHAQRPGKSGVLSLEVLGQVSPQGTVLFPAPAQKSEESQSILRIVQAVRKAREALGRADKGGRPPRSLHRPKKGMQACSNLPYVPVRKKSTSQGCGLLIPGIGIPMNEFQWVRAEPSGGMIFPIHLL